MDGAVLYPLEDTIEKKIEKATFVIKTDGTFDETNAQVDRLVALFTEGKSR